MKTYSISSKSAQKRHKGAAAYSGMFPEVNLKLTAEDIPALLPHSSGCPLCILYLGIVEIPYDSVHTNFRDHWTAVKGSTGVHFI